MNKIFPKSRVCVIDCYPSFEKGLKRALEFAKTHNLSLSSRDGKKIILAFCLKSIEHSYKTTQSLYPKVLCMSKKQITKKVESFVDSQFETMMKYLPYPYCGKFDLESPDLETAAENSLRQIKSQRKFGKFATKISLKA